MTPGPGADAKRMASQDAEHEAPTGMGGTPPTDTPVVDDVFHDIEMALFSTTDKVEIENIIVRCSGASFGTPEHLDNLITGVDGKRYPASDTECIARRERTAEIFSANPAWSVRRLAKEAGVSVGTAHAVIKAAR